MSVPGHGPPRTKNNGLVQTGPRDAKPRSTTAPEHKVEWDECWVDVDGDPVLVLEQTCQRPKRQVKTVTRFGPKDMMNDTVRRKQDVPHAMT